MSDTMFGRQKKFQNNRSAENKLAYNRQRNFCVQLTIKSKKDYYNNLDNMNVTDNKLFWKTVKPFFSGKVPMRKKSHLLKMTKLLATIKKFLRLQHFFLKYSCKIKYFEK